MRQPGRGGRCRPRSLGAWPRGRPGLFLDEPLGQVTVPARHRDKRVSWTAWPCANQLADVRGGQQQPDSTAPAAAGPVTSPWRRSRRVAADGLESGTTPLAGGGLAVSPVAPGRSGLGPVGCRNAIQVAGLLAYLQPGCLRLVMASALKRRRAAGCQSGGVAEPRDRRARARPCPRRG